MDLDKGDFLLCELKARKTQLIRHLPGISDSQAKPKNTAIFLFYQQKTAENF